MGLILKIIGVCLVGILLLGFMLNSIPYPFNIVGAIAILAGAVHIVKTILKNKNV